MNLKDAKNILDEILDLCYQAEDPFLNESAEGIYRDVQSTKTPEQVLRCASELMIFVNETQFDDMDLKAEIERLFNQLQDEYEEFE